MFEDMRLEDQLEMRQLRRMLYRAVLELSYIHTVCDEVVSVEHDSLIRSSEGTCIVDEGMKLLGVADLSAEELPVRLETA